MTIDARFVILWDFEFLKKGRGTSNFPKIRAIDRPKTTHKYITCIKQFWY